MNDSDVKSPGGRRAVLRSMAALGMAGVGAQGAWAAGLLPTPANLRVSDGELLSLDRLMSVGPLQPADANGLRLPAGFTSRLVARSGQTVAGTNFVWHRCPDGGATIPTAQGGWIYVGNNESDAKKGGASALEFSATGQIVRAYSICRNTSRNCAGGMTPWSTYLSCEEVSRGLVYECDPFGAKAAVARPGLGSFNHEAAAHDPATGYVYLTEDQPDGCLYRFVPNQRGNLSAGRLEVGCVDTRNSNFLVWKTVPNPNPSSRQTSVRYQVTGVREFDGGEGAWIHSGFLYITTKGDNKVWALNLSTDEVSTVYGGTGALNGVDNITAASNGLLYVAEDGGNMEVCVLNQSGQSAPVLRLEGHSSSELTGVAFSPDGSRLYFSSQRGKTGRSDGSDGHTFEVSGPFLNLTP